MDAMVKDTIGFFGLGAVGSVLLTCLAELSERDAVPKRFVVFVRNPEVSQDALFHAEHFFDRIEFVGVPDFEQLWAADTPHAARLGRCEVLINAALPEFNGKIIECALRHGAHCVDLASAMYDEKTQRTLTFAQYEHDAALRGAGLAAIINQGISPGVTNYLIAERLQELLVGDRRDLTIESIDLFLLEDIDSDEIVFSWSPVVALEELAQKPRVLENGRLVVQQPFADPETYTFPPRGSPHAGVPAVPGGAALPASCLPGGRFDPRVHGRLRGRARQVSVQDEPALEGEHHREPRAHRGVPRAQDPPGDEEAAPNRGVPPHRHHPSRSLRGRSGDPRA
jgi:saccharopine dehydrogenase-like NADP-dependent oxidoreductase